MFQPKKMPGYVLDRTMLRAKLDTMLTLYGMPEISEIVSEWASEQSVKDWGIYEMSQVLTAQDAGSLMAEINEDEKQAIIDNAYNYYNQDGDN